MAGEVVSIVLGIIKDLLVEESKFLSEVTDQVKEVETELIRMQCFLKDADKRQLKDLRVRNYVREIRHLAYRAENVLEKFAIEVESRREGCGFRKAFKRSVRILSEGVALHKVGSEIENIRENLISLTNSLETYGVIAMSSTEGGQSSNENQQRLRQTYPHQVEEYFVGMEDDIKQLASLVTDEGIRSHRVISIYGMGGLGKTTLARKIYNHIQVQRAFKNVAWVTITQQFNAMAIFRDILKQLLPDQRKGSVEKMEERELVGELYTVQKETNCLVVLDDLWKIEDWKCLNPAFPFAEANSKILITTRNHELAKLEFPYALQFLSEDQGWELLKKRAFSRRDAKESKDGPMLEAMGREIVCKCGKLPLAISVLGGVLSQKHSLQEWETVNKDVDLYLGISEGSSRQGDRAILQVLALSYDELPYHLKPCFLYLGHFREDEDIDAHMLYRMWIAEGMVLSNHRRATETLTDVAERYLYEMASRSILQVKLDEFSTTTKAESCYLHDLMRDFCLARGKEMDFLSFFDFQGGKNPLPDSSTYSDFNTPSRCSIHIKGSPSHDVDNNDSMIKMALEANGQRRSLIMSARSGSNRPNLSITFPQIICDSNNFRCLKVLKFDNYDFKGKTLPRKIKKLVHLRFLSLNGCILTKLPSSISQLSYLQTLDLRVVLKLEVPNVLWKLKRLRHLYVSSIVTSGSTEKRLLRLFGSSKLETLVGFNNDVHDIEGLSEQNNLRFFEVTVAVRKNKDDLSQIQKYLAANEHKLAEVHLNIYYFASSEPLAEEEKGFHFEEFFCYPNIHKLCMSERKCQFQKVKSALISSNLSELSFSYCPIEGDPMNFLGKLSKLRRLRFFWVTLVDMTLMISDANAFPQLVSLEFMNMHNLENWVVAQGSMPNLSCLTIGYCEKLEMIPDGLRFIRTLKKLEITMSRQFNTQRIQGIDGNHGPDYDKISHVPLITIEDQF